MPLARFRIRTLMIAVAVVAAMIYGGMLARRSSELRRVAVRHRLTAAGYLTQEQAADKNVKGLVHDISDEMRDLARPDPLADAPRIYPYDPRDAMRESKAKLDAAIQTLIRIQMDQYRKSKADRAKHSAARQYYERLVTKYEQAAWRPWLPVPPDPPEPD